MRLVRATARAILIQLEPIRVVSLILLGNVIVLFAFHAGKRDYDPIFILRHVRSLLIALQTYCADG